MVLQPILPASGTASRRVPGQVHDRLDRLVAIDDEHKEMALMFLSGYAPHVFDDVLDATEPITGYSLGDDAGHPAVIGWRAAAAADSDNVVR